MNSIGLLNQVQQQRVWKTVSGTVADLYELIIAGEIFLV
jgi:hypothetical protein